MASDVAPANRGHAEHDAGGHGRAEYEAEPPQELTVDGRKPVEQGHPQAGQRDREPGDGDYSAGRSVPGEPAAPHGGRHRVIGRGGELERAEYAEHDGGHDVDHHGERVHDEPRVLWRRGGAAGQRGQAERAGRRGDRGQQDQGRGQEPPSSSRRGHGSIVAVHEPRFIGAEAGAEPFYGSSGRSYFRRPAATRPWSCAHMAISTRLRAPSLAMRAAMWVLTVLSVM